MTSFPFFVIVLTVFASLVCTQPAGPPGVLNFPPVKPYSGPIPCIVAPNLTFQWTITGGSGTTVRDWIAIYLAPSCTPVGNPTVCTSGSLDWNYLGTTYRTPPATAGLFSGSQYVRTTGWTIDQTKPQLYVAVFLYNDGYNVKDFVYFWLGCPFDQENALDSNFVKITTSKNSASDPTAWFLFTDFRVYDTLDGSVFSPFDGNLGNYNMPVDKIHASVNSSHKGWRRTLSPTGAILNIYGYGGNLWQSMDNGVTFTLYDIGFELYEIMGISPTMNSNVLFVGYDTCCNQVGGTVACTSVECAGIPLVAYVSTDSGRTVRRIGPIAGDLIPFPDASWDGAGNLYYIDSNHTLRRSTDLFVADNTAVLQDVSDIFFYADSVYIAVPRTPTTPMFIHISFDGITFSKKYFPLSSTDIAGPTLSPAFVRAGVNLFAFVQSNTQTSDRRNAYYTIVDATTPFLQSLDGVAYSTTTNAPDFYAFASYNGVYMANKYTGAVYSSKITYNYGSRWMDLPCETPAAGCSLFFRGASTGLTDELVGRNPPGVVIVQGNQGVVPSNLDSTYGLYFSRDSGLSWRQTQFAGDVDFTYHPVYNYIAGVDKRVADQHTIMYSRDNGQTVYSYRYTDPAEDAANNYVHKVVKLRWAGEVSAAIQTSGILFIQSSFSNATYTGYRFHTTLIPWPQTSQPTCTAPADYDTYLMKPKNLCYLGGNISYYQKKLTSQCTVNGATMFAPVTNTTCPCDDYSYYCGFCLMKDPADQSSQAACVPDTINPYCAAYLNTQGPAPPSCVSNFTLPNTVKIPADTCSPAWASAAGARTIPCPTEAPTPAPTTAPSLAPSNAPSAAPTATPTAEPTPVPLGTPTEAPTPPTDAPSAAPSNAPTGAPTASPTAEPTPVPLGTPTLAPTAPTASPTANPTGNPTSEPTPVPLGTPTVAPTTASPLSPSPVEAPLSTPTEAGTPSASETPTAPGSSNSGGGLPLWAIILIVVVGGLIVLALVIAVIWLIAQKMSKGRGRDHLYDHI